MEKLRRLDALDRDLNFLRGKVIRLPAQVAEHEQELAASQAAHDELKAQARANQAEADRLNLEFESCEEKLNKFKAQLNICKTNAEYQATQQQIDQVSAEQEQFEEQALVKMEQVDGLRRQVAEAREAIAEKQKALEAEGVEVDRELAEAREQEKTLSAERDDYAQANVDPQDLRVYQRILATRKDSALARAADFACQVCFIRLTPQEFNLLLIGEQLVYCKSCGRILYNDAG